MPKLDFSPLGKARVALAVLVGTLGFMAIAVVAVSYTTPYMTDDVRTGTWALAILMPIFLSAPTLYYFANKLRQLAMAHRDLAIIAAQDSLTTCLNRGAFVTLVDAYLSQVNTSVPVGGALLVIDADHFKAINDHFGHSTGDDALKLIASTIKDVLRPDDLVGRVGGEEFAAFLPRADHSHAVAVAERIRVRVSSVGLISGGARVPISVSIGGARFEGSIAFDDLFRAADANMYVAKNSGRNCVAFGAAA